MELLSRVGLPADLRSRNPSQLSGGQRQRVSIARALALEPNVLVCDESLSALDAPTQSQILSLMQDLRDRFSLAYLFITHNLLAARYIADRIAVMYGGQIVEEGPADVVFSQPEHPYTQMLLAAVPARKHTARTRVGIAAREVPFRWTSDVGCRFRARCPSAFERCRREQPPMYAVGEGLARCFLSDRAAAPKVCLG